MILHCGGVHALPENLPVPTVDEIDEAIIVLRDGKLEERMRYGTRFRRAPRALIDERMRLLRPWQPEADGLQQARVQRRKISAKNCVCLLASEDYGSMVFACIDSILENGNLEPGTVILLMAIGEQFHLQCLLKYESDTMPVVPVKIEPVGRVYTWIKAAQLLATKVVQAENYLLLESDTLVLTDLAPLWRMMDACPDNTVFGVVPNNPNHKLPINHHLDFMAGGRSQEHTIFLTGAKRTHARFFFNGGMIAGKRRALETINDNEANLWPFAQLWIESATAMRWGEELILNWAISQPNLQTVTLDPAWNIQYCEEFAHEGRPKLTHSSAGVTVEYKDSTAKILHVLGERDWKGSTRVLLRETINALNHHSTAMRQTILNLLYRGRNPFDYWKNPSEATPELEWAWTGIPGSAVRSALKDLDARGLFPEVVLEVGSFRGNSAAIIARELLGWEPKPTIIALDTFLGDAAMRLDIDGSLDWMRLRGPSPTLIDVFMANVLEWGLEDTIIPFQVSSTVGLRVLDRAGIRPTLAYLDSSHEATETRLELDLLAKLMPAGSIILGDDYNESWVAVIADVDAFVKAGNHDFSEVGDGRTYRITLNG